MTHYKTINAVAVDRLNAAHDLEIAGDQAAAAQAYWRAARSLESQMMTAHKPPRGTKSNEYLSRIELAEGLSRRLRGEDGTPMLERSRAHLESIISALGKASDPNGALALTGAQHAHAEVSRLLGEDAAEIDSPYADIVKHMPSEIVTRLRDHKGGAFDMHWRYWPVHVVHQSTASYEVAVAFWEEHEWSDRGGGGISWEHWLEVYYCEPGSDELHRSSTKKIKTRSGSSASGDRRDLWKYDQAGIRVGEANQVEVYWTNEEGDTGPRYKLDLDALRATKDAE